MISSMNSSMIARSALAPVSFFKACSAIHSNASSSKFKLTSSIARSFRYCFKIAFFGSFKIRTRKSFVSPWSVTVTGSLPRNSGIIPNSLRSWFVTFERMSGSLSYLSFGSEPNPMDVVFVRRSLMIVSRSGNAPPQIKRILSVLTISIGVMAFFCPVPTGTSTSAPSRSFKSSC